MCCAPGWRLSAPLAAGRVALELRQFVCALHPANAIGDLDVRPRRHGVGIIVGYRCRSLRKNGTARE